MEMEVDRISKLPDNIVEDNLSRLSTRDVVRTSLLSCKWRHRWTTIPSLMIGDNAKCPHTFDSVEELAKIIDHFLLHHVGPIHKFKLYYDFGPKDNFITYYHLIDADIDRWILRLSTSHVKELSLGLKTTFRRYSGPSSVFSCENLTKLELHDCSLSPPETFKGFGNLKSLHLDYVNLTQDVLEILICNSPILERAVLMVFLGHPGQSNKPLGITWMPNFFNHLLHIRKLTLQDDSVECLALGGLLREYPLRDLQYLSMDINFNHQEEILAALCLATKSSLNWGVNANFSEVDQMHYLFTKLRSVRMVHIIGCKREVDFINYMLSTSPVLETMTISHAFSCAKRIVEQSFSFEHASEQVKIIVT
ncbi:hypothetical protein TIFTF001_022827 [Ficus carica]|uniref:F-box domain-containing protein n=1 Tax=Ficus carica TaxID=3494 RepID=A0AA88AU14_FICCA|nr:hypothetical protein TIFTF001_022827 [Ficus carica]